MRFHFTAILIFSFYFLGQTQSVSLDPVVGVGLSNVWEDKQSGITYNTEDIGYSYRLGVDLSYRLSESIYVSAGMRYARLSQRTKLDSENLRWGSQFDGSTFDPTLPSGELFNSATIVNDVTLIQFQLACRKLYQIQEQVAFYGELSLVPAFFLNSANKSRTNDGDFVRGKNIDTGINDVWLFGGVALGCQIMPVEDFSFFGQLGSQVNVLKFTSSFSNRFWNLGVEAGCRIKL